MKVIETKKWRGDAMNDTSDDIAEKTVGEAERQTSNSPGQTEKPIVAHATEYPQPHAKKPAVSAGQIILQWLTYAFWGWLILSLGWLIYIVITTFFTTMSVTSMVPYALAATMVLLPISLMCELLYSRHEPLKKTGAAMVVMVIHAVLFALFGIGSLIGAIFALIQLLISGSPSEDPALGVTIATLFICAAMYALTFLRTLNPSPALRMRGVYPATMTVISGVFVVAAFIGPVAQTSLVRDDEKIQDALTAMTPTIETYVKDTQKLPDSLSDVSLGGDAAKLVAEHRITYKPEGLVSGGQDAMDQSITINGVKSVMTSKYHYQLCANYHKQSEYYTGDIGGMNDYSTSINAYYHPAGEVCYKVEVDV